MKDDLNNIIKERLIETLPKTTRNRKKVADDIEKIDTSDLAKLAKIGINALIDEATGYQEERPSDDLMNQHKQRC